MMEAGRRRPGSPPPVYSNTKPPWGYIVIPVFNGTQMPALSAPIDATHSMRTNRSLSAANSPTVSPPTTPSIPASLSTSRSLSSSVEVNNHAPSQLKSTVVPPVVPKVVPMNSVGKSQQPGRLLTPEELHEAKRRADRERSNRRKPPCTLATNTPDILRPRPRRRIPHNDYAPVIFFPTGVPPAIRKDVHNRHRSSCSRISLRATIEDDTSEQEEEDEMMMHPSSPYYEVHDSRLPHQVKNNHRTSRRDLSDQGGLPPVAQMALLADLVAMGVPGDNVDKVMDRILSFVKT